MIAQLRIYTINNGQMDDWLKVFKEEISPIVEKHGMGIDGAWVDAESERFIWIRTFEDEADIERKEAAFYASEEYTAIRERVLSYLARRDITVIKPV